MRPAFRAILLSTLFVLLSAFIARQLGHSELIGAGEDLADIAARESIDLDNVELLIRKKDRTLSVVSGNTTLKSYKIVIGQAPEGDKMRQGDLKTPEGIFKVRAKYPHAEWHKFIWIDYPNKESWKKFKERLANGTIPKGSQIGGEIGIHGVPTGMDVWIDLGSNWTLGCIAMKNDAIDEVYGYVNEGTPIRIEP